MSGIVSSTFKAGKAGRAGRGGWFQSRPGVVRGGCGGWGVLHCV